MRLVLACLVIGCGSDPISVTDFPRLAQHAVCEHDATCGLVKESDCEAEDLARIVGRMDKSDPLAYVGKLGVNANDPQVQSDVSIGTVAYDATKARACVDAIGKLGCDLTAHARFVVPADCYGVLVATGAAPERCQRDVECPSGECGCDSGIQLSRDCCANTACTDEPALPAKLGDHCNSDSRTCSEGYCASNGAVCAANDAGAGAACEPGQCADGLACIVGTCKALPGLGEACPDFACRDEGATCIDGTCQRKRFPRNPCAAQADCSRYYPCDEDIGQCAALPGLDGDCSLADCPDGSFCPQTLGTPLCTAYTADGAPCMNGFECESGHCETTCDPLAACN